MAEEVEDTFDKLKAGAKAVAKKVADPDKDLGDEYKKEREKDESFENEAENIDSDSEIENKEPMSAEKITSHEPKAVKRDENEASSGEPV